MTELILKWLGRAPSSHFQTTSSPKMAGKPLKNKGKQRKKQESQGKAEALQPQNSWKEPLPATLKMSSVYEAMPFPSHQVPSNKECASGLPVSLQKIQKPGQQARGTLKQLWGVPLAVLRLLVPLALLGLLFWSLVNIHRSGLH